MQSDEGKQQQARGRERRGGSGTEGITMLHGLVRRDELRTPLLAPPHCRRARILVRRVADPRASGKGKFEWLLRALVAASCRC